MTSPHDWTLIVSGGGSGGHLFPALAVIEELLSRNSAPAKILFLTAERSIDQTVLNSFSPRLQAQQVALPAIDSGMLLRNPFAALWRTADTIRSARKILKAEKNPVVLATGGYGSIPGGIAAWRNKVPVILLEQNVIHGRATSLLARIATKICASFPETSLQSRYPNKTFFTGNPVRNNITQLIHNKEIEKRRTILVLGGSQGAKAINQAMMAFAKEHHQLLTDWNVIHHTGETDCPQVHSVYEEYGINADVSPFFNNIAELYSRAALVVSRAGGTSLAEIACAGIPAILVPYPKSIRDHQQKNAQFYVDAGAAIYIPQTRPDFTLAFAEELQRLLNDTTAREQLSIAMHSLAQKNAAQRVVEMIDSLRGNQI
ncbi:MAG TPA: undecaprenyldiphospho-muramoylpentapeptide beta-N-acetylglucosaminyltransferase [Planctomicrobium sp.]|nr:undecaprenyldiphospho-muramoylpentapeptide beta-N-acetylglucosaminyltransferase [Planctomicrobium sp.]